jgi:hypothetical protein
MSKDILHDRNHQQDEALLAEIISLSPIKSNHQNKILEIRNIAPNIKE